MLFKVKTFASNVNQAEQKRLKTREGLVPFRKAKRKINEYTTCVSYFDGQIYDGKRFYDAGYYIDSNPDETLVVLTRTERWHLKKLALDLNSNIKVAALESDFPFLCSVKYKDAASNYKRAQYELKRLKSLGFRPTRFSSQIFDKYNRKLAREVREKSIFDNVLSGLSPSCYSGVFLLADKRRRRQIYCLDFNAMFASCMLEDFCDFTKLSPHPNKEIFLDQDSIANLPNGFYEVSLIRPTTEFITRFHPFKLRCLSSSLGFKISSDDVIKTVLTSEEVRFYGSHFQEIYLHYGYNSPSSTLHPLKPQVEHVLTKKGQTSGFYRDIWKLHSTIIYTTPVVKSIDKRRFSSLTRLIKFIKGQFDVPPQISDKQLLLLIQNDNNFKVEKHGSYFLVSFPCFDASKSIFSLYIEVITKAKCKLLQFMHDIHSLGYTEICYSNIDSVHVSIESDRCVEFNQFLEKYIGSAPGQIKVEAIGDEGYWFDVGRYWILKDSKVIKFANSIFNLHASSEKFADSAVTLRQKCFDGLNVGEFKRIYLPTSFSSSAFVSPLVEPGVIRYERYQPPASIWRIRDTKRKEKFRTKTLKTKLFEHLKQSAGS